jgi:hypothetical protein
MSKEAVKLIPRLLLLLLIGWMSGLVNSAGSGGSGGPAYAQSPTPQPPTKPVLLTDPVPDPKQQGVQYFPATGHTLRGAFLDYWNRYGGLAQFGYPLTEEFFEEVGPDNKQYQVQYFERNRFELHPENAGTPYEVLLGTLGREFRTQDPPAAPITGATYFRETGHNLSGKFKQYWDTHGGLFVHGYPITEAVMERSTNGKEYLVQWFERSRFELHPENAGSPYEVLLGMLGRQLSEKKGYPYGRYPPYGYAVDYSWLSGVVEIFGEYGCFRPECGCSTLRYENVNAYHQTSARVQMNRPDQTEYYPPRTHRLKGSALVVFGGLAPPDFKGVFCPLDGRARFYLVVHGQANPAR